ncbi:MAG: hypothetical protein PVJ71_03420 [Lysobacterales bacterium]|jgi:hypothetical protein
MRLLVFILVLAVSAQPLQAGFCDMDMENGQEKSHYDDGAIDDGHDCCDTDETDVQQEQGCGGNMHCAPCFVSAPVLPVMARLQLDWSPQNPQGMVSGLILAAHASPPFRPPIS